jgi:diguanylate cyclase (GGDEF)-like protein
VASEQSGDRAPHGAPVEGQQHDSAGRNGDDRDRDVSEPETMPRRGAAHARVQAAAERDRAGHARDRAALERDQHAANHDLELSVRDVAWAQDPHLTSAADLILGAAQQRKRAAADRAAGAEARARAAEDRRRAAADRELAARDRLRAQADRELLLAQLVTAETDALTGTRTRAAGLLDLDHEIERARRSDGRLVIAYVDVVGLKTVNDTQGHGAGDELLQRVVRAIRQRLRSYDIILRLGGDEFLCVMTAAGLRAARSRFRAVQAMLAADPAPCEIRVGFAQLSDADDAAQLIRRADVELTVGR